MSTTARKILVIDNYDSFVFNLVQYLQQLGAECMVVRNDSIKVSQADKYDGVLISPGPGTPESAGISIELVKYCADKKIPLLGGATVSRAPELLHGKTSLVTHQSKSVLENIPSPFTATRYHSLAVERESLPDSLEVTGTTESGVVMAIQHKTLAICGVQFHPESVLTEHGYQIIGNWLQICGDKGARARSEGLSPVVIKV
jgi:para-aminobenzoate synthetase component 2